MHDPWFQKYPELRAELPLNAMNGREEGFKGKRASRGSRAPRLSLIARGALGKVKPEKPPTAALPTQLLWALSA